MWAHSYSLGSGCDGCASTFKRGGGGLAIGGGCSGGRPPRRQVRAAPILNTSGSARWFGVAGQCLASATNQGLANDVREQNLQAKAWRVQQPKALQTIHASKKRFLCCRYVIYNGISAVILTMVLQICNIEWDIACATYYVERVPIGFECHPNKSRTKPCYRVVPKANNAMESHLPLPVVPSRCHAFSRVQPQS